MAMMRISNRHATRLMKSSAVVFGGDHPTTSTRSIRRPTSSIASPGPTVIEWVVVQIVVEFVKKIKVVDVVDISHAIVVIGRPTGHYVVV